MLRHWHHSRCLSLHNQIMLCADNRKTYLYYYDEDKEYAE